jgi:Mg2+/Co2+ transporter CorB
MRWLKNNSNSSAVSVVVWALSLTLYERILISNVFIGLVTVPIYIILKSFPFFVVFGAGILTTLSVLILLFYFLGAKFVGTWAILQKFAVTFPTSFVLSHLVKLLPINPLLDYIILFFVGYMISTPLIFLTYYITRWLYGKKR